MATQATERVVNGTVSNNNNSSSSPAAVVTNGTKAGGDTLTANGTTTTTTTTTTTDHDDVVVSNGSPPANGALTSNGHAPSPTTLSPSSPEQRNGGDGVVKRKGGVSQEDQVAALEKNKLPLELPSLGDIKRALPPHVFESSVKTSFFYVAKDLLQVTALFLLAEWIWSCDSVPRVLLPALVPAYWLLQGTLLWAVFVLGHDAGHGSFSRYTSLNDAVGNVLHSLVLCPYYCWKLSHRQHHAFTGNMDKDEIFYPVRETEAKGQIDILPCFGFGLSWFIYLFAGYAPRTMSHFNPREPMFARHVAHCTLSIAMVIGWAMVLWHYLMTAGLVRFLVMWAVPEFVFASYLVLTTFLHHTDEDVPWYDDSLWTFVRGQLSSIDRHYGWCHDIVHNIGTHQIHHLFATIPHYHLEEATRAFRARFPQLVRIREESILPTFQRIFYKWLHQRIVPDNTLVHVYT